MFFKTRRATFIAIPWYYENKQYEQICGIFPFVISAMILSAGLGTRLRPLTDVRPKPLVPVGDRTILEHVLAAIRDPAIDCIAINVHHRANELAEYAQNMVPDVAISFEEDLLGTAGGLKKALPLLGEHRDVLIWNGDILAKVVLSQLIGAHRNAATLSVVRCPPGEGNVGIDREGKIVRLRNERIAGEEASGGAFAGIHIVGQSLHSRIPAHGCLIGDVYIPAMKEGARLDAHVFGDRFLDVGSIAQYAAANRAWLAERQMTEWVHPTAQIGSGARVVRSIIGAGAVIAGSIDVVDAIVWPGVFLETSATNAIAYAAQKATEIVPTV